jgi:hypothetical protein
MAVTGVLSEFSLPEIFQFLDHGNKTGLLTIKSFPTSANQKVTVHYIWFQIGRVVSCLSFKFPDRSSCSKCFRDQNMQFRSKTA